MEEKEAHSDETISQEDVKEAIENVSESKKPKESIYEGYLKRLQDAQYKLKMPLWAYDKLRDFDRVIEMDVPVMLDKKHRDKQLVKLFSGFRAEHNNARGPYKGGIRFYPAVTIEEVKGLAAIMTLKNSLADLPFGGGKGGVAVNTKLLNKNEIERLARSYARKFSRFFGSKKDIAAPDIGTDSAIMDFMVDEMKKVTSADDAVGSFTGKSVGNSGLKERETATGLGAFYVFEEFMKQQEASAIPGAAYDDLLKKKNVQLKIAVQGFGNVGASIVSLLHHAGHKIIAVSDSKGGIASANGLDPKELEKWKRRNGSIVGLSKTIPVTNEQLLTMKADILILAALENQITEKNAGYIKAPIIFELANDAIGYGGDKILRESGKIVLPDILVNSGGVIVSYFEWLHAVEARQFKKGEIEALLKEKMLHMFQEVKQTAVEYHTSYREASYLVAIKKLVEAMKSK